MSVLNRCTTSLWFSSQQNSGIECELGWLDLGVGTLVHYPMAAHQMPAYQGVAVDPAGLPATEGLPRASSRYRWARI